LIFNDMIDRRVIFRPGDKEQPVQRSCTFLETTTATPL
jgi:hypothetical protein